MSLLAWSWLLAGVGVFTALVTVASRILGSVLTLGVGALWIIYSIQTEQYGFLLSAGFVIVGALVILVAAALDDA